MQMTRRTTSTGDDTVSALVGARRGQSMATISDLDSLDVFSESSQMRNVVTAHGAGGADLFGSSSRDPGDQWVALPTDALDGTLAVTRLLLAPEASANGQRWRVVGSCAAAFFAHRVASGASSLAGRVASVSARDGTVFRGVVRATSELSASGSASWVTLATLPDSGKGSVVRIANYAWMQIEEGAATGEPTVYLPGHGPPPTGIAHTSVLLGTCNMRRLAPMLTATDTMPAHLLSYMRSGVHWRPAYVIVVDGARSLISSVAMHGVVSNTTGMATRAARVSLIASGASQEEIRGARKERYVADEAQLTIGAPMAMTRSAAVHGGATDTSAAVPSDAVVYFVAHGLSLPPGETVVSAGGTSELEVRQWAAGWRVYFVSADASTYARSGPSSPVTGAPPPVGYRFAASRYVPAGAAVLYDRGAEYAFTGAAHIPATPADQPIDVVTGNATDILADVARIDMPDPDGRRIVEQQHQQAQRAADSPNADQANSPDQNEAERYRIVRLRVTLRFSENAPAIDRAFVISYDLNGAALLSASPPADAATTTAQHVEWSVPIKSSALRDLAHGSIGMTHHGANSGSPVLVLDFVMHLYRAW